MLKNFKITVAIYCLFTTAMQASLQVAIPVQDFCPGNSLVFITRDSSGLEHVAGCVSLGNGKTTFSHDEISQNNQTLSSLCTTESRLAIITDAHQDIIAQHTTDDFIYLYFDVDRDSIVRVLVIKNNLLADNPYNVLEFSAVITSQYDDEDEEDDFFGSDAFSCDELSQLNLQDITGTQPVELSTYDTVVLSMYALWALQSAQAKQVYKNFTQWMQSNSHE